MTNPDRLVPDGARTDPMDILLYAGGSYGEIDIGDSTISLRRAYAAPAVSAMTSVPLTVVLGPLQDASAAMELAGRVQLALEAGATVVFLYVARLGEIEWRILPSFAPSVVGSSLQQVEPIAPDPAPHPAFRVYLVQYGQTAQTFNAIDSDAEALAYAGAGRLPAAFMRPVATGKVYVLPIHMASGFGDPFHRLIDALLDHRDATAAALPTFLDDIELPGEAARRAEIAEATALVARLTKEQTDLANHKRLLSHLSGQGLETLVIDELNFVLDRSALTARDTIERFAEDFEIVSTDGAHRAIGEAKAIGKHIGYQNVDQLNWHRAQLVGASETSEELGSAPNETPALLVANVFRNDERLDRRLDERVSPQIAAYARRSNVLIIRTADLLRLVARRLEGHDDAEELAQMILRGGGGWLEVADDLTLHVD